jgi:AraC-like DNA-binding protein
MKGHYFKYLTAGTEDNRWGLYLKVAGYASNPPGVRYPMHRHPSEYHFSWDRGRVLNEYQISYITRGSGVFETRQAKKDIEAGMVFMVFPGQWHRYKPDPSTGWDEYYLGFEGDIASRICDQSFYKDNNCVRSIGHNMQVLHNIQDIITLVQHEQPGHQQLISGCLMKILSEIYAAAKNSDFKGKKIEEVIRNIRFEIREHFDKRIPFDALAAKHNLGYSYFRRLFKTYTGLAPAQYHMQVRLQKSRELLRSTDLTIKEIAYAVGFESPFHFSKMFRKKTGVSPLQFREQGR